MFYTLYFVNVENCRNKYQIFTNIFDCSSYSVNVVFLNKKSVCGLPLLIWEQTPST